MAFCEDVKYDSRYQPKQSKIGGRKAKTVRSHFFCTTYKYPKPCWRTREMRLQCLCQPSSELQKGKKIYLSRSAQRRSLAGKVSICQYQACYKSKAALWIVCLMRSPSEWSVSEAWVSQGMEIACGFFYIGRLVSVKQVTNSKLVILL